MRKLNLLTICALIVVLMACEKETKMASLPEQSISIDLPLSSDVIEMPGLLDIQNNATMKFELKAVLTGNVSADDHTVTFTVDTSKIGGYIAKYGNALVLPINTYLFYKPIVKLAAGETKSEPAQINLGQQTILKGATTYVLPVRIKSVDGKSEGTATDRVIYYVFRTGKSKFVDKTGWEISALSSQQSTGASGAAAGMLDANNGATFWLTSVAQNMPQWVTINFKKDVEMTAVIYYFPTSLGYPKNGGYPTSIQIETSMDGTTWTSRGIFAGNLVSVDGTFQQILDLGGAVTARYLRFTMLSCVKYAGLYNAAAISGISLKP